MEGVMMKNKEEYAVAVRKPDKEIVVEKSVHKDFSDKVKLFKLPIFRGMLAFIDSMVIGIKVLNFSAGFFDDDDTQAKNKKASKKDENKKNKADNSSKADDNNKTSDAKDESKSNALLMVVAVVLSIGLSIGLFMVLPAFIIELLRKAISSHYLLSFIEGMLRLAIFIVYVVLASMMTDIKRVFMYHGAEHKTINCIENGFELTLENVRWQSKQHKRCGTSFMLLVILISLIMFMLFPTTGLFWRVLSRILLVPFIAGISYEIIRLAGRSDNAVINIISKPGLWMQGLTTKEPDDAMIEVAIKSVDAVFDWRAFLEQNNNEAESCPVKSTGKKQRTSDKQDKDRTGVKASPQAKSAPDKAKSETAATVSKGKVTYEGIKRNMNTTPIFIKDTAIAEDEDDEILSALDKYFDDGSEEQPTSKTH